MDKKHFPIVVMHNVSSANRCSEFVRIAVGLGYKTLIITNAQGSAAQRGIPTAQKLAYSSNANFMALADLNDVKDLFNPEELIVVAPAPYGKEEFNETLVDELESKKYVIVFGGNDPGLSRKDLDQGRSVQLKVGDIGSIGTVAIVLAKLRKLV
jgi:SpoU rRNA methylase family enzyme